MKHVSSRLSVAYLVTPVIAVAVAIPAIMNLRVGHVPWWISNLPFWLGLLSAPGYVYVWTELWRGRRNGRARVWWTCASLAGALLASVWGTILLLMLGFLAIFPAITLALVVHMWARYLRFLRQAATKAARQ